MNNSSIYSETFEVIIERICANCGACTEDCNPEDDCVLYPDDLRRLHRLCVQIDDLTYDMENYARKSERDDGYSSIYRWFESQCAGRR